MVERTVINKFRELCQRRPMIPEEVIHNTYRAILQAGDISIDGGAHVGVHTLPLLNYSPHGRVLAYEPLPDLAKGLAEKLSNWPNLILRECAIQNSSDLEHTTFQRVPKRLGRSGIRSATINTGNDNQYEVEEIVVTTTTIDKDIETLRLDPTMVKFIKLDLEGAEFRALQGAERTLRSGRPLIAMENGIHSMSVFGYDDEEVDSFLERVEYRRISFFGEQLDSGNFDFWYMFCAPTEHVDTFESLIKGLYSGVYYKHAGGGLAANGQTRVERPALETEIEKPVMVTPLDGRGRRDIPTSFPELDALQIFDGTRVVEAQMPPDFPRAFTLELLLKSAANDAQSYSYSDTTPPMPFLFGKMSLYQSSQDGYQLVLGGSFENDPSNRVEISRAASWRHIAVVVYENGMARVFVDGVSVAIGQSGEYSGKLLVGQGYRNRRWRGSLLYCCISAGELYTTNFIPAVSCSRTSKTIYYLSDDGK